MNWGKGIIIGMAAFIGFILFLVISLMQHKVDLVSEDYYQQELDYDQHYDAVSVYQSSGEKISVNITDDLLQLHIPPTMQEDSLFIHLKRPDNELLDLQLATHGLPQAAIPLKQLQKGRYELMVSGKLNAKKFIYEDNVTIP